MKVSLFKNIKNTTPITNGKSVFNILDSIKNGDYKSLIVDIRIEPSKEVRDNLKSKLHYVTWAGQFKTRSNDNLKIPSGLACLDFDKVEDLQHLRALTDADKFTFASFISPSGNGLKVLVKIPFVDNNEDYQDYYVKIQQHYNIYADTDDATKAIANACYLSYDSELYSNPDSNLFTDKFNKPLPIDTKPINIPVTDPNEIANRLEKWFTKRWSSTNRNNNLHAYARQMNAFGVDKSICESYLLRYEMEGFKSKEIVSLINSAYKYSNEFNSKSFEDSNKVREIKNLVIAGQPIDVIKATFHDGDIDAEVEVHKDNLKVDEFWYYTDKGAIKMATFRFLKYLEHNDISKYYPNGTNGSFIFIKKKTNFISEFPESRIKDFTLNDLRKRGAIDAFELCADRLNTFNQSYLSMITTSDIKLKQDTKEECFIYYKNSALRITKNDFELLPYDDVNGFVWENQVIDREITLNNESDGEFKTFIWKVSGEDKDRYYTLKSVIGYLLHSYQNEGKPKVIIFNDEMISDDVPNGGSGKGLLHKGIGYIKNVTSINGKGFDPNSQFAYQTVSNDTQVLLFDDIDKSFRFENLFSVVTEGLVIEKKGQDAIKIPFADSPKLSITTNYTVKGDGASHHRRVFEVEMANYFNDKKTPEDEFGHLLFSDWDDVEWAKFDNYMIRCVQYYLKNGLVESNKINLAFRKLKQNIGAEFMEWMETGPLSERMSRKAARDAFNNQYPTLAKYNTAQKFNKKVKEYCDYYKLNLEESKFNGVPQFQIRKEEDVCPF